MNREERTELLEKLIDSSIEFKFVENEDGDDLLKLENLYNRDEVIYINFWELIHLLKHYTGTSRVLLSKDEVKEV